MEYLAKNDDLAKAANYLNEGLRKSASQYFNDYLKVICRYDGEFIASINDLLSRSFGELEKNLSENDPADPSAYFTRVGYVIQAGKSKNRKFVTKIQGDLLFQLRKVLSEFKETRLTVQKNLLKDGMEWLSTELKNIVEDGPEFITAFYETDELKAQPGDSFALKAFKLRKRTWAKITGKPVSVKIPFRELQQYYLPSRIQITLYKLIKNYGKHSFKNISVLQELFDTLKKSFQLIEEKLVRGEFSYQFLSEEKQKAEQLLNKKIIDRSEDYRKTIDAGFQKTIQQINDDLKRVDINVLMNRRRQIPKLAGKLKKKTEEIPGLWYKNQTLFFNAALMDLLLLSVQNRIGTIVQKVVSEIEQTVENKVLSNLKKQNEHLTAFAEELKTDPSVEFKPGQDNWENAKDALYYKEIIDKATGDIKDAVGIFPETIEIMGEAHPKTGKKSLVKFENQQFDKIDIVSISLNRLVNYLIQANLVEPLRQQLDEVPRKLRKTINIAEDVIRLISFSLNNSEPDLSELPQTGSGTQRNNHNDVIEFINEGNVRIKDERIKTKELKKRFFSSVNECLNITIETLQPDKIILSAGNLKHYIKKSKSARWRIITEKVKMFRTHIRRRFTKIWYRRSEGVLAARKLSPRFRRGASWQKSSRDNDTQIDELLNILDAVSPNPQVLESLPFYYKQLFLGKQKVDKAFWRGRKKALADAERTVKRFKNGLSGGLLITGEQNSGKTYLSQNIANKFFDNKKVYHINPPESGSIDVAVFKEALIKEWGGNTIPQDSVIIINDLELWWERSENGFDIVNAITEMISDDNKTYFLIINVNIHSFRFMNKMKSIDGYFLNIIECEPFNAEELKDIILFRHRSTALKFELNGSNEDDLSVWKQARLFSKYFDYSRGNVGVALQAWISNVEGFEDGKLTIKKPVSHYAPELKYLNPDWMLLIVQFVLHRRLTIERLNRITKVNTTDLQKQVNTLIRAGILTARPSPPPPSEAEAVAAAIVYELNPFMRPHLVNELVDRGVL